MHTVAFVLLNYLAYNETIECVESLEKLKNNSYDLRIVIVENGSKNESYKILLEQFENRTDIHIIESKLNLGFAKGNNLGYKYARNELNADMIIVQNSDTIVEDNDFVTKALELYEKEKYDILGPDIVTLNGTHQNPITIQATSEKMISKLKFNLYLLYFMEFTGINNIRRIRRKSKSSNKNKNDRYKSLLIDTPLHGACYIFSMGFLEKMGIAFYPETFLYMEEDIMYYVASRMKFKTMYSPELSIKHKEDASTDCITNDNTRKKMMFIFKNQLMSCNAFLKLIRSSDEMENFFN